jgi:hypothetical protein
VRAPRGEPRNPLTYAPTRPGLEALAPGGSGTSTGVGPGTSTRVGPGYARMSR